MMRRALVSGAAALLIGGLGPGSVVAARADESAPPPRRSVVAHAAAEGMRGTYTMPDFVAVSEFFDGGGPVAESLADGTGRATSFAALPWPGENAVTAPGALSVVAGRSVPLAYPFSVSADYPTTPSAVAGQPVTIGPDGVRIARGAAPVPFGQGDASLNQLLAQSGLSVRTMASGTPGRADILVITSVHQVPGAATGTLVQRFGGASTEIVIGSAE